MTLDVLCLVVLATVLLLSCVTSLNVGLAALASAWIIGGYVAPQFDDAINVKTVVAGFPVDLFLNLVGTTLLFAAAQVNGTLRVVVEAGLRLSRGRAVLVPPLFFILACVLAAVGPGNIAAAALLAPSALAMAERLRIPPLVMIIAVGHGSIAGGASPLTPIGLIILQNYREHGLADAFASTFFYNAVVNTILAVAGGLLFGYFGRRLSIEPEPTTEAIPTLRLARRHIFTLIAIATLVIAALIVPKLHIGLAALTCAVVLLLGRAADERESIRAVPWNVILMVAGVSTLVALCEKTGTIDLLSRLMKYVADQHTVVGWSAFVTGLISIFSSTSGVVLPTFLPAVGDIVREVGGGDPASVAAGIVIGSNLVDVSPLSTIGALCIAAVPTTCDPRRTFLFALAWGFAMAPLAAVLCQLMLR